MGSSNLVFISISCISQDNSCSILINPWCAGEIRVFDTVGWWESPPSILAVKKIQPWNSGFEGILPFHRNAPTGM